MKTAPNFPDPTPELARALDAADELATFRNEFVITDPDLIYLDGNSLGRLPRRSVDWLHRAIETQWGDRLIRSWNESWIEAPLRLAGKIARLVGAQPEEILVTDSTSVNLFKLAAAALQARPGRIKIVSDVFNFPSDLYVLQGLVDLLGGGRRLELIPSADGVSIADQDIQAAIDAGTALVTLTHVAFKSAFQYDLKQVTEWAHQAGALMLWDLSHSTGATLVDLNECGADLAVGCTYKYLNGGPGSPAFLYVRRDLQPELRQPIWGWFAARSPFEFGLDFTPAEDISRFRSGTLPMLSLLGIEPAVDILLEAGMARLRLKSIQQTEYLIYLAEQWLTPLGFQLGSPRQAAQRGSHVSLRHPEAFRIIRALIETPPPAVRVIPDFRAPDNIRLGVTPLYTTFEEIHRAMQRVREVVESGLYQRYSNERQAVT